MDFATLTCETRPPEDGSNYVRDISSFMSASQDVFGSAEVLFEAFGCSYNVQGKVYRIGEETASNTHTTYSR